MKTLKKFAHVNAKTIDEAASLLQAGHAAVLSGGTDLLGTLRFEVLPTYPEVLVNLKTIPGMEYIKEEGGMLKIGAQTRLEDIAKSELVHKKYTALAEGAHRTATPHIREMGTISREYLPDEPVLVFPQPGQQVQLHPEGREDMLRDGWRQQVPFHIRSRENVPGR